MTVDPESEPESESARDVAESETTELEQRAAAVLRAAEDVAAATGRAMVSEAKDVRRRILHDASRRREELVAELERVRALLERALVALRVPPGTPDAGAPDPGTPDPGMPAPVPSRSVSAPGADTLFARLRSSESVVAPAPGKVTRSRAAKPRSEPKSRSEPEPEPELESDGESRTEPATEPAPEPESESDAIGAAEDALPAPEDPDAELRRHRDAVVDPLIPDTVRAAKRLLQDEQNCLLDAIRRARGRYEPGRLLPDPEHQREAWTALLAPSMDAAFLGGRAAAGKTGRVTAAPPRVVGHATAVVVVSLRDRLAATVEAVVAEGPYESANELQRALGSAISARYREWKGAELEASLRDAACAAYARGSFEAAGSGTALRWVPADPGRCPDCDDNALEPTLKGATFPTGQQHPPAHPGCRCLLVPLERGGGSAPLA